MDSRALMDRSNRAAIAAVNVFYFVKVEWSKRGQLGWAIIGRRKRYRFSGANRQEAFLRPNLPVA